MTLIGGFENQFNTLKILTTSRELKNGAIRLGKYGYIFSVEWNLGYTQAIDFPIDIKYLL